VVRQGPAEPRTSPWLTALRTETGLPPSIRTSARRGGRNARRVNLGPSDGTLGRPESFMAFPGVRFVLGSLDAPGFGTSEGEWACFTERRRPGPVLGPLLEFWEEGAGNLGVKGFRVKASGR